jgi:hypothetical protein
VSADKPKPPFTPASKVAADPSAKKGAADGKTTGRVKFDDRGNAVWEWQVATGAYGLEVSTQRLKKLEHPALSLADEGTQPNATRPNPLGKKKGYDPYDSGRLPKTAAPPKKDLRKLGDWLKIKKQAGGKTDEE